LIEIVEAILTCVDQELTCSGAILGGGFLFEKVAVLGTKSKAALILVRPTLIVLGLAATLMFADQVCLDFFRLFFG